MFHKVKNVLPLPEFRLSVQFCEGVTKIYDVKPLFEKLSVFAALKDDPALFGSVSVDVGGYGIIWGEELDLSRDELWEHGTTPFDRHQALNDAMAREQTSREIETNQSDISLKLTS